MKIMFTALVAMILSPSCGADDKSADSLPTSTIPPPAAFDAAACPVADDEFCTMATAVANALASRDADALLSLSRIDTIVCAEMRVEYFPGCAEQEVLTGHGVSGPDLIVQILPEAEYLDALHSMTEGLDAATLEIIGVGTCGPNEPGQRTYHLSWTATHSEGDAASTPVVGSFESLFVDDWRIVLSYFGTLEDWTAQENDPFTDSFCEAGQTPWGR